MATGCAQGLTNRRDGDALRSCGQEAGDDDGGRIDRLRREREPSLSLDQPSTGQLVQRRPVTPDSLGLGGEWGDAVNAAR